MANKTDDIMNEEMRAIRSMRGRLAKLEGYGSKIRVLDYVRSLLSGDLRDGEYLVEEKAE